MAFKHKTDTMHYHDTAAEARECEDYLTALCAHGMALHLCAGPQHYPYDEDESTFGGYYNSGPVFARDPADDKFADMGDPLSDAAMTTPPMVTTVNMFNYGGCENGQCSWHDKCNKHRQQDAARAGTHNASIRARHCAYND